jgi:hypothetical protein
MEIDVDVIEGKRRKNIWILRHWSKSNCRSHTIGGKKLLMTFVCIAKDENKN